MTNMSVKKAKKRSDDGGYYAIKGFLYQFDKTLIEVISNPEKEFAFENTQDIDCDDYVLQVKHKETQDYRPHKIREPLEKMMDSFSKHPSKRFCLYCYFRDTKPHDRQLTLSELDEMISADAKARHVESVRKEFVTSFTIRFSEDYESQFDKTINLIKLAFDLLDDDEGILYHSIFHSKLLNRSILPKSKRRVSFAELKDFLKQAEITVFYAAYAKYMGAQKYVSLIKKKYFTFSAPNINSFERLFLIECDSSDSHVELAKVATCIANKFCRKGKSPQPYIAFRNLTGNALNRLKQEIWDSGLHFCDGTNFDGDRFRSDQLTKNCVADDSFRLKIVPDGKWQDMLREANIREVFEFFIVAHVQSTASCRHYRIQVDDTEQISQMIG